MICLVQLSSVTGEPVEPRAVSNGESEGGSFSFCHERLKPYAIS